MTRVLRVVAAIVAAVAVSAGAGCAQQLPGRAVGAPDGVAGTGRVISAKTADSAGTEDLATIKARLATGSRDDVPDGYHRAGVIVDRGLGSYTVAVPAGYRAAWWPGDAPAAFVSSVAHRDLAWGEQARRITSATGRTNAVRGLVLDTSTTSEVRMVVVTAIPAPRGGRAELVEKARSDLRSSDARLLDVHPVVANGVDGVYAEYLPKGTTVPDRAAIAVYLTDPHHGVQWGVTCDVPQAERDAVRAQCLRIAGSFRPLPAVSPAGPGWL